MSDEIDRHFLKQAIDISKQAIPSSTCFRVGAVLVDENRHFIASGFTQELGEGWHAETVAIKKAIDAGFDPKGATIYSTMEPCSVRASGKGDCSQFLIEKGIARVVFALCEPPIFVNGRGKSKLKTAGIKVEQIPALENEVITINKHLLSPQNLNQSKLITYAACSLLVYYAFACNQLLAADPQTNYQQPVTDINKRYREQITQDYCSQITNQVRKFTNFATGNNGQSNTNQKKDNNPISNAIADLPNQASKGLTFLKGFVYDPDNPVPFFDNLIALQAASLAIQNQMISAGEKCLSPKNAYVIGLKENYNRTTKYITALKLQKVLVEQSIQSSHK